MDFAKLLILVSVSILTSCMQKVRETNSVGKNSEQEERDTNTYFQMIPNCCSLNQFEESDKSPGAVALRKVAQITEIKRFAEENTQEIRYLVSEEKIGDQLCVRVQIGLEKETHFSNRFLFYVNARSQKIQIWDPISNSIVSVENWRKARSK